MGKNEHTDFDKRLKESFAGFKQSPDPALWSRIEKRLQRHKRIVLFARFAAAASLLLLLGLTGWLVFQTSNTHEMHAPVLTHEVEKKIPEAKNLKVPEKLVPETKPVRGLLQENKSKQAQTTEPEKVSPVLPALKEPVLADINEPEPAPEIIPPAQTVKLPIPDLTEIPAQAEPILTEQSLYDIKNIGFFPDTEDFLLPKTEEKKWQLALSYGTIHGQSVSDHADTYETTTANFAYDLFSSKLIQETSMFASVESTTHAQPITLGFKLSRTFFGVWGLETGLLFTRLKTTSKTNIVNGEYAEYGSELFYVGIPASISLNMIRGRRFGMYISQGLMIEKGVKNRYYSNYYAFDVLKKTEEESYVADGIQISSLTALGFEFRLSNLISIYAQPGLQVFFLNKTQPYSIRSSSAIWPSLQTGLKIQI